MCLFYTHWIPSIQRLENSSMSVRSIGTCLATGSGTLFAICKATRSTQRGARLLHEGRADERGAQILLSQ